MCVCVCKWEGGVREMCGKGAVNFIEDFFLLTFPKFCQLHQWQMIAVAGVLLVSAVVVVAVVAITCAVGLGSLTHLTD